MGFHAYRIALSVALLAPMAACHTPSPRVTATVRTPPPPAAQVPVDASYDWHGLLIAPFGSVLKDIPVALHEVLLFREAHGGSAADNAAAADAECYATDAPAPRFVGHIPDEYLLCFRQDRLSRVQASVRLTATEGPGVFAAACAEWLAELPKDASPPNTAPTNPAPTSPAPTSPAPNGAACEGRDGAIRFRSRLEEEPDQAEMPQKEAVLSITLESAPSP
jgi:hypothetical protein